MKKNNRSSILFVLVIILSLIGCHSQVETPTDVTTTINSTTESLVSAVAESDTQEASEPQAQIQPNEPSENNSQPTQKVESKNAPVASTAVPKETVESTNDTAGLPTEYEAPTFTDFSVFEHWLKEGTTNTEERSKLLANIQNVSATNSACYYRPKLATGNDWLALSRIETYSSGLNYYYHFTNQPQESPELFVDTSVLMSTSNRLEEILNSLLSKINDEASRKFDEYGSGSYDGITYYYFHYSKNDHTSIYWQQNGMYYWASLDGHYDQLDQILPLLKIERVSYAANDNTVTQ